MTYLDDIRRVGRSRSRLLRLTATRLPNIDKDGGVCGVEKCVKLVSNGVVSGKWPEARRWLELTATAPHQATPKGSIAGESKREREDTTKPFIDANELEKLLQDADDEAFVSSLKLSGNVDADKWEKLLRDVSVEAVGIKLKPRGETDEATAGANTLSFHGELDADDNGCRMTTMTPSSTKRWAFVPLLRSLGEPVTVVLTVITTMLLTELLLCISLSTGPVIVVVRGVAALVSSTIRRVSVSGQATQKIAKDVVCCLAQMFSERKLVVAMACVATTTMLAVAPPILE